MKLALLAAYGAIGTIVFLLGHVPGSAAPTAPEFTLDPAPRGYISYRARGELKIDGKLNEPAWADAPWSESFRDIEGDPKPDPPVRTRMKMLWDDQALYIAAELEEKHIWGSLRNHDSVIFHDNDFEVFIDPDTDSHFYGELELNALNTTWDLLLSKPYKDGGRAIEAWEITGLKTAVQINGTLNDPSDEDRSWTVEIAWPWKSLKELSSGPVPPRDGDQWRINFSRVQWDHQVVDGKYNKIPKRPEHNWVWSPQGTINMHRPERWGVLQFSTAAPGTATLRPDSAQAARDYLHRVYYAQVEYRKKNGKYAVDPGETGGRLKEGSAGLFEPRLETTRYGFEASVEQRRADGGRERWRITQDARITRE